MKRAGSAPAHFCHLTLMDETAQGPFRTRGMGRWVALGIGGLSPRVVPRSRETRGAARAPLAAGSRYGVRYEPPRMSLLPNVGGQSVCTAGGGTEPPVWKDCRKASIAGQ